MIGQPRRAPTSMASSRRIPANRPDLPARDADTIFPPRGLDRAPNAECLVLRAVAISTLPGGPAVPSSQGHSEDRWLVVAESPGYKSDRSRASRSFSRYSRVVG
jgi:hypothetical protein